MLSVDSEVAAVYLEVVSDNICSFSALIGCVHVRRLGVPDLLNTRYAVTGMWSPNVYVKARHKHPSPLVYKSNLDRRSCATSQPAHWADDYRFTCQNDSVCLLVAEQGEYGSFLPGPHILAEALSPRRIVAKPASYQYIEAQDIMVQSTTHHDARHSTSLYEAQDIMIRGTGHHCMRYRALLYEAQYIIL